MNKVYNTVWNESTGTWVVTSELTRKGGRRPPSNQANRAGRADCGPTYAVTARTGDCL
ncbi:ESPR domain-containing protein [Citrobacter sp. wls711]|uniref:ESPR domain-containing protein n=1 Tax=Citrobacter sp. wls711 TaxID=2576425 RepID=UPI0010CA6728|nr:ESPR domain-containing protein [Citrobacter sp. wls711]TKU61910.1 hypothetical protein FDW98_09850 [Citrobacter sp. wls711]HEE0118777.1 ESPR domain-containing protein [Citrobacter gillenii]